MASPIQKYPSKVIADGVAVGDFKIKAFTSAKGKPMRVVEGQILSGQTFVNFSQFLESTENPYLPSDEEKVRIVVVPGFKDDKVLHLEGVIVRPELSSDAGKSPVAK